MTQSITSDRDYLEIIEDQTTTLSTGGSDPDAAYPTQFYEGAYKGIITVTHNLGAVPFVRAFFDPAKDGKLYNTRIPSTTYLSFTSPWLTVINTTTTTKIILNSDTPQTSVPIYYRIYRFGAKSLTSDERIDRIFLGTTGSATLGAAGGSNSPISLIQTLPHGQSGDVLNTLQFSDDGATWYEAGTAIFGGPDLASGPPGGPYARYYYTSAIGYADSTNFYIRYEHNYATSRTIYVRYALDLK